MSDALSYSVELAAERSSVWDSSEKMIRKSGLYSGILEHQLKKLGLKGLPSNAIVNSLASLKHDPANTLDALIESGYKYYNDDRLIDDMNLSSALYLLDVDHDTPSKYLNVFRKLKEKMDYKTVNVAHDQLYQVDKVYKISRFGGSDVCRIIDFLAEVGYKLGDFHGKKWLRYCDVDLVDKCTGLNIDEFLKASHKLKEKLGYKSVNKSSLGQINYIFQISQILGYSKAIDTLAEWKNLDVDAYGKDNRLHAGGLKINEKKVDKLPPWGVIDISHDFKKYKIDKKKGITNKDVEILRYISDRLWKEYLEGLKYLEILSPCFYLQGNSKNFIECFQHLNTDDKKRIIRSIFKCEKASNEEITRWLDENEPELVREVGIGLI